MTQIFTNKIEETLPKLVEKYSCERYQGHNIELWVFSDRKKRLAAEQKLQAAGVNAKVRSALKPLVHAVVEEFGLNEGNLEKLVVKYPSNDHCQPRRFVLETYPLGELVGLEKLSFVESSLYSLDYQVEATLLNGERIFSSVFAPNSVKVSSTCDRHLSPTGWVRIESPTGDRIADERIYTDYEQVFDSTLKAITHHSWGFDPFQELNIHIKGPMFDEPIAYDHEHLSLSEALHEDLYFSVQEWFKFRSGHAANDRSYQFGQIIPDIVSQEGDYQIEVEVDSFTQTKQEMDWHELDKAQQPISSFQISSELKGIVGERISALSVSGRSVEAVYHYGSDHPVLISGGQHANETSGIIGALRGAKELAFKQGSHFAVTPLENPDGYETYLRLIQNNPNHMHHAARYTALGNDLDTHPPEQPYENAVRMKAFESKHMKLHINLHGYPAHEWIRPFSGYIPKGFERWTIPKGFFLILRYSSDEIYRTCGRELLWRLTERLANIPKLCEFNKRQMALFSLHAGENDLKALNGIPCIVTKVESSNIPLQLISEYPDESIYGEYFQFAHEVQKAVVIEAYEIFQSILGPKKKQSYEEKLF